MVYLIQFYKIIIMALIKFGMMMTDARGKLGGQVFTKTRSGATVRTKVTPANPQTTAQQQSRAILGNLSTAWRNLSESDRRSWNAGVENFSKTNVFGDTYNPSGKNLFVGLNANLLSINATRIDTAPLPIEVPALIISSASIDISTGEISFVSESALPGAGTQIVFQASKPSSAGKNNFSGAYATFLTAVGSAMPSDLAIYTAYTQKFGTLQEGQKVAFRVFVIAAETGQKSVESTAQGIASS